MRSRLREPQINTPKARPFTLIKKAADHAAKRKNVPAIHAKHRLPYERTALFLKDFTVKSSKDITRR